MAIAPTNNNVIFAGGRNYNNSDYVMAVCYSTNGGSSWKRAELSSKYGYIYAIVIHPSNPAVVYAGGYCYSGTSYPGKVFKTMDGGANWTDVSHGIDENYNYIYSLVFDPKTPTTLYAGASRGIYRSLDGGANWVSLTTLCRDVYALAVHPRTSVIYAAGYGLGVYSSVDGGSHWTTMNEGLTSFELECMVLDSQNDLLLVGTTSEGVFRYNLATEIAPIVLNPTLPDELRLLPNFPNPFNPTTTIKYEISSNMNLPIQLSIYNVAGQLMRNLVNEIQQAGTYTVNWDGSDDRGMPVSSGMYFCILQAGDSRAARKITLIR
ncbi:MAG: T9SS type A sorting domain-containing protein [bacterium]|nr:T9SS type A sorting domain-containing protein [bacterium]